MSDNLHYFTYNKESERFNLVKGIYPRRVIIEENLTYAQVMSYGKSAQTTFIKAMFSKEMYMRLQLIENINKGSYNKGE